MNWLNKIVEYQKGIFGKVIKEDFTHIVLEFQNGSKICTSKCSNKEPK